jgi:acetyl esterase/lipase
MRERLTTRMTSTLRRSLAFVCFAVILLSTGLAAEPARVLDLWPGVAPGEKGNLGEEKDTTKPTDQLIAGRRVIRLGNVSKPSLSLYRPAKDKDTGAAVLVCPGGGYHILAMDLEGTEVCEWLNAMGVTAALLKYRVPKREGLERHVAPLQDAQRALGLLRWRAQEFGLDPRRLGALGFSAGGHLIAALAGSTSPRAYPAVDEADAVSCRPDFNIVIYPGYLVLKDEGDRINPSVAVTTNHPPTFLVMSQDDPVRVENAVLYYLALKQAGVPSELHVYPTGGHGYGLRRTEHFVTTWPDRAADWLRGGKWLERGPR